MMKTQIGIPGLLFVMLLFVCGSVAAFINAPEYIVTIKTLFGFPAPAQWIANNYASWGINLLCICCATLLMGWLNRHYNFLRTTDTMLQATFLLFMTSMPWLDVNFASGSLMLLINLVCMAILFQCYKARNATQEVFIVATLLSAASLFQYAFLFIIPAYVLALGCLNIFRIKELSAMAMGLFAPYWLVGAYWLVIYGPEGFNNLQMPQLSNLFEEIAQGTDRLVLCLNIGLTALLGLVLGLNNSARLFAGNKRVLALNNIVAILGIICVIWCVTDLENILTYLPTIYFCVAVEVATACVTGILRNARAWLFILTPLYALSFFMLI